MKRQYLPVLSSPDSGFIGFILVSISWRHKKPVNIKTTYCPPFSSTNVRKYTVVLCCLKTVLWLTFRITSFLIHINCFTILYKKMFWSVSLSQLNNYTTWLWIHWFWIHWCWIHWWWIHWCLRSRDGTTSMTWPINRPSWWNNTSTFQHTKYTETSGEKKHLKCLFFYYLMVV